MQIYKPYLIFLTIIFPLTGCELEGDKLRSLVERLENIEAAQEPEKVDEVESEEIAENVEEVDKPIDEVEVAEEVHEEDGHEPPPSFGLNSPTQITHLGDDCESPMPGSLRAAILSANQKPGQDEIVFSPGTQASITLDCCLPVIVDSLNIHGPLPERLEIDASATEACNVFEYRNANTELQQFHSLDGIRIRGGSQAVLLSENAYLHVIRSEFIENGCEVAANDGDSCGAIRNNDGRLFIDESSFIDNHGSYGPAILQRSLVSTAANDQGPERHYVESVAETSVIRSTFVSNEAQASGGAIYNQGGGRMEIFTSTFTDNHAETSAGAIYSGRDSGLLLFNSTISGNHSDGRFGAIEIGDGLLANGVDSPHVEIRLIHNTIAFNEADDGGAIGWIKVRAEDTPPEVTMHNSILANSAAGNCSGTMSLVGKNNIQSDSTCVFVDKENRSGLDPMLEPLDDFGGPTRTHALEEGSPAIDSAGSAKCLLYDQRGAPRPIFDGCDVGAFEFGMDQDEIEAMEESGEQHEHEDEDEAEHGDDHDHGFNHSHDDDEEDEAEHEDDHDHGFNHSHDDDEE